MLRYFTGYLLIWPDGDVTEKNGRSAKTFGLFSQYRQYLSNFNGNSQNVILFSLNHVVNWLSWWSAWIIMVQTSALCCSSQVQNKNSLILVDWKFNGWGKQLRNIELGLCSAGELQCYTLSLSLFPKLPFGASADLSNMILRRPRDSALQITELWIQPAAVVWWERKTENIRKKEWEKEYKGCSLADRQ